ncbi:hypothetical protein AVEN_194471-1 [Araneus ventricosus]|uniref:Uncharacterized protein n=1 Tax=Araneus ventricosus TaxID=182803 RepID=A0A4Y2A742_ARAVE|nr:hypothetical protein AVEN_194471-1 [Araneus ventricosus]
MVWHVNYTPFEPLPTLSKMNGTIQGIQDELLPMCRFSNARSNYGPNFYEFLHCEVPSIKDPLVSRYKRVWSVNCIPFEPLPASSCLHRGRLW